MGDKKDAYRGLVGRSDERRPRRRWKDNIKLNFKE
jgi:hypothetical protein